MLACFQQNFSENTLPLVLLTAERLSRWLAEQPAQKQAWVESVGFKAQPGSYCLLPDSSGKFAEVLVGVADENDVWSIGALPLQLPEGSYCLETDLPALTKQQALLAWGLGAYQFNRYQMSERAPAQLFVPSDCHFELVETMTESIYLTRDLINTPAEDMGPLELAETAVELGNEFQAEVTQIVAEDLIEEMYPAIFTVGRGSYSEPRLIDLQWGDNNAPKLTLVGKGVCFDSGGLDIKNAAGMRYMKKDMGGAAHVLGLARMIMQTGLPVRLRVLIPAVENAVSGDSYRPGDVITMRNGTTVEVTNTDAEGRLVLADALVEACSETPDLLIDFATLTGAARVAVGMEIAALFTEDEAIANSIMSFAKQDNDPVWQLPLHQSYLKNLESSIADLMNAAEVPYAGATIAALFLQQFVDQETPWLHFDVSGWNVTTRPGHPEGGEALGLRAVFDYLRQRFSSTH